MALFMKNMGDIGPVQGSQFRGNIGPVLREQGRYGSCLWRTVDIWILCMRNRGDTGPFVGNRGDMGPVLWGTVEIWVLFIGNSGDIGPFSRE